MVNLTQSATDVDEKLAGLVEEITAKLEAGERIDLSEYARSNPEQIDSIRKLLPALEALALAGRHDPAVNGEANSPAADATGHRRLGDFRLIREIGRGGMGTVYEAEQISMGRRVALKVLPFAALVQDKSLQRFRNEVRAAAALDHPHIVSVYSVGEERGVHFYAMQLIRGQTLADMIAELNKARKTDREPEVHSSISSSGPLPRGDGPQTEAPTIDSSVSPTKRVEQAGISTAIDSLRPIEFYRTAARLGIEAADALQHAHDVGVLHRDIKPSNLMLDAEGKLYVTDFGLARIEADASMTMTGDIVGTLRYMAPEQALAKRVVIDHRADIYSLSATLYELLTLQPAFGETDRSDLLKQIAFEEPLPLRKRDRHIPADLEAIVLKAMGKSPEERYETAQQLAADLRAFLEGRTTQAKPPTMVTRTIKWFRRHPAATRSVAAILLMAAICSTLAAVWQANRQTADALADAQRNYQLAEAQRLAAQQSANESRAVIEFLTNDVLAAAMPNVDQSNDLTVKAVLANADERVAGAFVGQPATEVAVRVAIGRSYLALGDFKLAREQFERARDVAVDGLGPRSLEAITAEYNIARLMNIHEEYATARVALEAVLKTCLEEFGPLHPLRFMAEYQLGNNARRLGWDAEAIERLERVLNAWRRMYGSDHESTLAAMGDLAMAYWQQGNVANAENLARERLNTARRLYGPNDLRAIRARQSLVRIPSAKRSNDDIRRVREKTLAAYRIAYGNRHRKTLEAMRELASTYSELQKHDKASNLTAEAQRLTEDMGRAAGAAFIDRDSQP